MRNQASTTEKTNTGDRQRMIRRRRMRRIIRIRRFFRSRLFKRGLVVFAFVAVIVVLLVGLLRKPANMEGNMDIHNADYSCGVGYEGLRVKRVMQILGLGNTTGMGGAYYDENAYLAVSSFQQQQGLPVTGEVDKATWKRMGYSDAEWDMCGNYHSPVRVKDNATRDDKVEAMISRASEYLGDPYVIGASGPPGKTYGVDCSGLVMQGLYAAGVQLKDINPVTHAHPGHEYESRNMWLSDQLQFVDYEDRQRGDLIFYQNESGVVIHIAIYLGDDQVIESWPDEVQISPMIDNRHPYVIGVKRAF